MANFDPLAAFALQAVANAQAAIEEATLNLGTLLSDVQAKLSVGDVLTATVLPPQDGNDRISLLGQMLAAQLPPGINPGETITLQVTGFTNTAILVRNLGVVDPENPPETPASTPVPRANPPAPSAPSAPVAPPRELFVAASVRPPSSPPVPATQTPRAATPRQQPAAHAPVDVEARLIATRASTTIGTPSIKRADVAPQTMPPRAPQTVQAQTSSVQSAVARVAVDRPQQTPETTLLTRLRVPLTPATITAAKLVEQATRSVTSTYEKLDALLAKLPSDPRTASLRSTLAFVARFDLRNTRALPEQIASYVSNVVTSAESKIADIVRAWTQAELPPDTQTPATPQENVARSTQPSIEAERAGAFAPNVAAHAAERSVALDHDVKTALLQLVSDPPAGSSQQVVQALRDALTATTAVQLNALLPENNAPNTITIPLPAYFYDGGQPAQLRISRDAPNAKNGLDADNFHIAFVLDTKSLGMVAIDVQTVGRSVSVDVKTETARSADRFRASLVDLRGRLESMHYRVATMAAGLAAKTKTTPAVQPAAPARTSNLDMQA